MTQVNKTNYLNQRAGMTRVNRPLPEPEGWNDESKQAIT
jgi:hypothetical protein